MCFLRFLFLFFCLLFFFVTNRVFLFPPSDFISAYRLNSLFPPSFYFFFSIEVLRFWVRLVLLLFCGLARRLLHATYNYKVTA